MITIKRDTESFPIRNVTIGIRGVEDLVFDVEMWEDNLTLLRHQLVTKKDRDCTDFTVLNLTNGGTITLDLNEVLFVSTTPYDNDSDYTSGEDEFYDYEYE